MRFIHKKSKCFIFQIKANRLACRDGTERDNGQWKGISETVAGDTPVEVYLEGIKQKVSAGRSPANSLKARANHILHSILAYVKLEKLRLAQGTNHFAMRAKVYLAAVKAAYKEVSRIRKIEVDYEPA